MKILLSCYYFSPYRGGEAAVGWQYATRLAALGHEVTVIYGDLSAGAPMKADLDRYRGESGMPDRLRAVHVQAEGLTLRIHELHAKPGLWFLYYPAYGRWQDQALEKALELQAAESFDLVHQVTIIGYREPGRLWKLDIPFFWGPINGAAAMPWGFISSFGWKGRYQHVVRNVLNAVQLRLPGRGRQAARHAAHIWAVTEEDRHMVEDIWGYQAETMIETGSAPEPDASVRERSAGEPLRLVWCGILEARKSLELILHALAGLPATADCTLDVIGGGMERERWEDLATELDLAERVRWHGRVSHERACQLMRTGHALVHSSVKEGTPHVVLEAMANAMPVICHDACGMGVAVDETSGIKVPMVDPETSIRGFQEAIRRLLDDPELLRSLSQGALARAGNLSWDKVVGRINETYRRVLKRAPEA